MSAVATHAVPLAALASLLCVLAVAVLPARVCRGAAALAAVLLLVLVPPFTAPAGAISLATLGALTGLLVAGVRSRGRLTVDAPVVLLALYGAVRAVASADVGSVATFAYALVLVATLVLAASVARSMGDADRRFLLWGVLGVAALELAVAVGEQVLGLTPPWAPIGSTQTVISSRHNLLLPALAGRSIGTLGHALPLGTLFAVAVLVLLLGVRARRTVRVLGVAAGLGGIVLSGSRSVLLVLAVVLCLVVARRARSVAVPLLLGGAAALVWLAARAGWLQAATQVQGSISYRQRAGVLASGGNLFDRPTLEVLVGSGWSSVSELFALGYLSGAGLSVTDNELVNTFARTGLVGAALLVAYLVVAFRRASTLGRVTLGSFAVLAFSFNVMTIHSTAILLVVLAAVPAPGPDDDGGAPVPPPPARQAPRQAARRPERPRCGTRARPALPAAGRRAPARPGRVTVGV